MTQKVVLLDLEQNMPTAQLLRDILQHYSTLYLFNCAGRFEYALDDLTELASWMNSAQVVVLDTPEAPHKEFEYAVVVGQLMALLEPDSHVEIISAQDSSDILVQMLQASNISAHLILIQPEDAAQPLHTPKYSLPSIATIQQKPYLQLVKKYCDALAKMSGKPNTVEKLKNSLSNILQVVPEKAQRLVGLLINLKIIKRYDEQIAFRKKVLKQWIQLDLNTSAEKTPVASSLDQALKQLQSIESGAAPVIEQDSVAAPIQSAQQPLFKNFDQIDPVQLEVARKLRELKADKPKDIYALRDLLEQMFPQSDVRLLLKELLEKGYIYWNGHEVVYSHEMFLN
ncbi:hypothetical protein HXZ65_08360 [Acinetobacter indicus]|uniref:hypothetical protein n=1 Tax=Acinetobacter indicus TaxID=756892 RepID=UPI00257800DE|nr:hypothetical protein [Acinetobacter indicus]MDM1278261.1 hypothetical protein [Acinetobacter indicus]